MQRSRTVRLAVLMGATLLVIAACDDGTKTFRVRGTVHDVQLELGQALIEHDDIPGLMPGMTMSFDVPDADVVARMRSGQLIEFDLVFDGRSYVIAGFDVVGSAPTEEGWVEFGDALVHTDPAPDFTLTDQDGAPVALSDLAGRVLLVDFVFTRCPGPCPLLTTSHVGVQRALDAALRERVHFVSISVDPGYDTPDKLRAYGEARGVDFDRWSFLTGRPDDVDAVLQGFGVGRTGGAGDPIEHTVITYLVDRNGRIVKRYFGLQHAPEELAGDMAKLVGSD